MEQSNNKKHAINTAALYCGLSRNDNLGSEPTSITDQKNLLKKVARGRLCRSLVFR
ncbi:recombinase family protein [Caproicibacter fermentans]|uniref:hypothetical protein n=1 Tax=Caproicibacter fermentans TaxID=2576756 RepID=UPI001E2E66D9|nr:hypothetical protein [Caproicibacter fermentans]